MHDLHMILVKSPDLKGLSEQGCRYGRRTAGQPEMDLSARPRDRPRRHQRRHRPAAEMQHNRRSRLRHAVHRQTQSAIVIRLCRCVEVRCLDHPAHQHERDAQAPHQQGARNPHFRQNKAHATYFDYRCTRRRAANAHQRFIAPRQSKFTPRTIERNVCFPRLTPRDIPVS